MSDPQIVMVPLKDIDRPAVSGRDLIDPRKILELAESIREKGLMEPVILTPRNGRFEIVAGDRRYLAHEHLGRDAIPAIIKELDDTELIVYRAIENLQRENLTPLEEARAYNTMREKCGMSVDEICKATGKVETTVKRYLRFWRMPDEFKEAVEHRGVSLGVAEVLMQVDDPGMRGYYLKLAVENGITVAVAELWLSEYRKSKENQLTLLRGDDGGGTPDFEYKPVYVTCMCCAGPVEIKEARQLVVCLPCLQRVKGLKASGGF